jgi:hypothetical protein
VQLTLENYELYLNVTQRQLGNNPHQLGGIVCFLDFEGASSQCLYKNVVVTYRITIEPGTINGDGSTVRTVALNIGGRGSTSGSSGYPVVTAITGYVEFV